MKYEKNRKIAGVDELKVQKMARILIIPAVVVILVLVILIADRRPSASEESSVTAALSSEDQQAAVSDSGEQTEQQGSGAASPGDEVIRHDFDSHGLRKNAVSEINELVAKYQRAKVTGDAKLLYETFGRYDEEGLEEMQSRLDEEAKAYESYDDTVVYTADGPVADSYFAFISSKLKFTGIETAAPMLTWAYVLKAPDGSWYMKEPDTLTETEQQYLEKVSSLEDVALLDAEMRKGLAQAVLSDVQLAALYQVWAEGEPGDVPSEPDDPNVMTLEDDGEAASEGTQTDTVAESPAEPDGQSEADVQISND